METKQSPTMNPVSWILRSIWRILTFNISAIGLTSEKKEDKNSTNGKSVKIYNLDHAILNINIPPTSMWMNMGYWKVSKFSPHLSYVTMTVIRLRKWHMYLAITTIE